MTSVYKYILMTLQAAVDVFGGIDYLVLNHIIDTPFAAWTGHPNNMTVADHVMDVNFKSYVHLASHALAPLEKSRGSIVVVSSVAGGAQLRNVG